MLREEPCRDPQNPNISDLSKKLLDACKNGEAEEVRDLMQNGAPFTTDWLGTSPLHFAAQNGHTETAEILLRAGVSRDTRTKVERTPLHLAAQEGHLDIVRLLIEHGADIDAQDLLKMTPLHWAVERGHYHAVECLVAHGADVNIMSKFDKTPLDIARNSFRDEMIPILEKNINVARPRHESRSSSTSNSKTKSTVLPNKSNRTSKVIKAGLSPGNVNTNKGTTSINISKTSVDALKKLLNGSGVTLEDSSKDVLNTLAALAAEATGATNTLCASNSSSEAAEALQWLDSNSNYNSDDNMFTSAIESGGTVSLTEAGKLALSGIKDSSHSPSSSPITIGNSSSSTKGSKVITLVAESNIITNNNSNIVFVSSNSSTPSSSAIESENLPSSPKMKRVTKSNVKASVVSNKSKNVSSSSSSGSNGCTVSANTEDNYERIRKEIELKEKELEEFKAAAEKKEKELQALQQQLEQQSKCIT